nr:hypothetical protein [Mycoplasmopsis bovis]
MKKLVEHIQIYITIRQKNEFKGRVQIIDGTLKSYNSDEVTFLNDQEKARLKVAKILPYFTLVTYIPKSQFITDHTKEICWSTIFELFGKCAYTGKY